MAAASILLWAAMYILPRQGNFGPTGHTPTPWPQHRQQQPKLRVTARLLGKASFSFNVLSRSPLNATDINALVKSVNVLGAYALQPMPCSLCLAAYAFHA